MQTNQLHNSIAQLNHCCHRFRGKLYPTAVHSAKRFAPLAPILSQLRPPLVKQFHCTPFTRTPLCQNKATQMQQTPCATQHTRTVVGKHERRERCFIGTQFAVVGHRQNPAGHLQQPYQPASPYNCGLHTAIELRQNKQGQWAQNHKAALPNAWTGV